MNGSESAPTTTRVAGTEVRLPRPPGVFRRFLAEHPRFVDWFIVGCYLFGSLLMLVVQAVGESPAVTQMADAGTTDIDLANPDLPVQTQSEAWIGVPSGLLFPAVLIVIARTFAVATALLLRRRFPLVGLVAVMLCIIGDGSAVAFANVVALQFMLYAVPVYRSVSAGWVGYGVTLIGSAIGVLVEEMGWVLPATLTATQSGTDESLITADMLGAYVMMALWLLAVLMLGINLGNRRRYLAAVIEHAHQLARERDQRAQLAVAEERSRIAREMHDIVAHSVSVMIALSEGAAQAVEGAPRAASDAMRRSAETGRTALAEMRRLLGVLSDPSEGAAERVPQPSIAELPRLVETFREAGLDVSLDVSGSTSGDRGQELAIYRIVQEGLTNALRYAGSGARVHVRVNGTGERTQVEVRDDGPTGAGPGPITGVGAGRGLQGLTERVRMFGGTIESGRVAGGGWRLQAELPVSAAARVPVSGETDRAADGPMREEQP